MDVAVDVFRALNEVLYTVYTNHQTHENHTAEKQWSGPSSVKNEEQTIGGNMVRDFNTTKKFPFLD